MSRVITFATVKRTPMSRYKDHPIYGVAVSAPENRWYSRGLVFDRDLNQTIEIKRIQPSYFQDPMGGEVVEPQNDYEARWHGCGLREEKFSRVASGNLVAGAKVSGRLGEGRSYPTNIAAPAAI